MFQFNSKTGRIVAAFTAVATTVMFTGCANEDADSWDDSYEDQMLKDDNGDEYRLHQNQDGTETARYKDGREVTFRRDSDGNMNFVSGSAGLLAGMAAGYFLFHGYDSPRGSWDSSRNRYSVSEPVHRIKDKDREEKIKKYAPAAGFVGKAPSKAASSSSNSKSKSEAKSSSSSSSSAKSSKSSGSVKSGFGSAGARSAAS